MSTAVCGATRQVVMGLGRDCLNWPRPGQLSRLSYADRPGSMRVVEFREASDAHRTPYTYYLINKRLPAGQLDKWRRWLCGSQGSSD
jgi:hypothetical protein